jgi:hypothetical protein
MAKRTKCLLTDKFRCTYFEEAVLPMAQTVADPKISIPFMQAAKIYMSYTEQNPHRMVIYGGTCASRNCQSKRLKGFRYCPECGLKQKKEKARLRKQKQRKRR